MAKKQPKPILATKHNFVESLDNMMSQSLTLISALDAAFKLGVIPDTPASEVLKDAAAKFRASIFTEE